MPPAFEIEIPPEQAPLCRALAESGLETLLVPQTAIRLTEPPASLHLPAPSCVKHVNALINNLVGFDGDMAARMLRVNERRPDPKATWAALTHNERKQAKRLWHWALDSGLGSTPQGRPSVIDSALVLYYSRLLAEACGKPQFMFTRPMNGWASLGTMWRALMAALPLAESYLSRVDGFVPGRDEIDKHAETIGEILVAARQSSKRFADCCRRFDLGLRSGDVAEHPAMFRYAVSLARRSRQLKRRPPPPSTVNHSAPSGPDVMA
jgi:hypothetical protein